MSVFSVAMDYERRPSSRIIVNNPKELNRGAHFRRMEQFDARRNGARTGAVTSPPQHLDARLLEDGEALEIAWGYEITTLIAKKRLKTPEADAVANAARAAAALVVAQDRSGEGPDAGRPEGQGAGDSVDPQRRTLGSGLSRRSERRGRIDRDADIARFRRASGPGVAADSAPPPSVRRLHRDRRRGETVQRPQTVIPAHQPLDQAH